MHYMYDILVLALGSGQPEPNTIFIYRISIRIAKFIDYERI